MADDVDISIPPAPDPVRLQQLAELAAWHDEWVARHLDNTVSDPSGHPEGSDYNQHHADIDAAGTAEDEFHARAREIFGGWNAR